MNKNELWQELSAQLKCSLCLSIPSGTVFNLDIGICCRECYYQYLDSKGCISTQPSRDIRDTSLGQLTYTRPETVKLNPLQQQEVIGVLAKINLSFYTVPDYFIMTLIAIMYHYFPEYQREFGDKEAEPYLGHNKYEREKLVLTRNNSYIPLKFYGDYVLKSQTLQECLTRLFEDPASEHTQLLNCVSLVNEDGVSYDLKTALELVKTKKYLHMHQYEKHDCKIRPNLIAAKCLQKLKKFISNPSILVNNNLQVNYYSTKDLESYYNTLIQNIIEEFKKNKLNLSPITFCSIAITFYILGGGAIPLALCLIPHKWVGITICLSGGAFICGGSYNAICLYATILSKQINNSNLIQDSKKVIQPIATIQTHMVWQTFQNNNDSDSNLEIQSTEIDEMSPLLT